MSRFLVGLKTGIGCLEEPDIVDNGLSPSWSLTGNTGTITAGGLYSATTVGTGYVTASSGGLRASVLVAAHAPLVNVALGDIVPDQRTSARLGRG